MLKRVICILIITLFLSGCSNPSVKTLEDSNPYKDAPAKKYTLDIINLETNSSVEVPTSSMLPAVEWSPDSKHFLFNDDGLIRIFETSPFKELSLTGEISKLKKGIYSAHWLNNEEISFKESNSNYYSFNLESMNLKQISHETYKKSIFVENIFVHPQITEGLKAEIIRGIGAEYSKGILSFDKTKFLYNTKDKKTYLYTLSTGIKQHLFTGIGFDWSPDEKRILYSLPKNLPLDELDPTHRYQSEEFDTYVIDINTHESIKVSEHYGSGYFSPDGKYLAFRKYYYEEAHPA